MECSNFGIYSEDMLNYCINDVKLNFKLYEKLKKKMKDSGVQDAVRLEHSMQLICSDMRFTGVRFNRKDAKSLEEKLSLKRVGFEDKLKVVEC
mgnify:FL=1